MPPEAAGSALYGLLLGYGIAMPLVVSALLLVVAAPWWRRAARPEADTWATALALGAGYAVGQVGVTAGRVSFDALPPFPPREATDWLWYLTPAAVALGLLDSWKACPAWGRWVLRATLWLAVVWVLLPPAVRKDGSRAEVLAWLSGLGAAGLAFWAALVVLARRPGAMLPLTLCLVSAGSAAVLGSGGSFKLAQLAGVLAAALLPVVVRTACRPAVCLATAPVVLLLPGLWLTSCFYAYAPTPLMSWGLLMAASLAGAVGWVPGVRRLAPWQRGLICAVAACLLVAGAVLLAHNAAPAHDGSGEDWVLSPSLPGCTINNPATLGILSPNARRHMETSTMGKVLVTAKVENLEDLFNRDKGLLEPEQVRSVEVTDALVDTGATTLSMPKRLIDQLGLRPFRARQARTSGGVITLQIYGAVRLTIQGRDWHGDVAEVPDDCPVLIGQLPLEGLDFVVDPQSQRLIGNPAHGGEHIIELY